MDDKPTPEPSEDEMLEMIRESPSKFIAFLETHKLDFGALASDLDMGRRLVQDRYSLGKEDTAAVEFVFWFAYTIEREARDLIVEPEVLVGARRQAIELLVDKLSFGAKIDFIAEIHVTNPKKDEFVTLMRKVQTLRNDVAHGRFDKLTYGGYKLSDSRGQLKLLGDLMNALLRKST